ncbi:hypothetical protein SRABI106_01848 [Rahnella aquatilis]|nr:hypothetical protein SRABI106_01848 [Rahnella aquatilis]
MFLSAIFPGGRAIFQQCVSGINIATTHRQPRREAEVSTFQTGIIAQPPAEPRLHVDIIGLKINFPVIEQTIGVVQIHTQLHNAVLPVKTRQAKLPFGAMAVVAVQPGHLRNVEFRPWTGRRQEGNAAVAQIEMVDLSEENITDAVWLDAVAFIAFATQRAV